MSSIKLYFYGFTCRHLFVLRCHTHAQCEERTKMGTLTVRLSAQEDLDLQLACEQSGKSKSEVVRELLAESLRTYRLRQALNTAHAELGPAARQAGWLTEDDLLQEMP